MDYFQPPLFDLLKLGQAMKTSVARKGFASHVVDAAAVLARQMTTLDDLVRGQELIHELMSHLSWREQLWIIPIGSYHLGKSIYPAEGHERVLPDSLLGTALRYRSTLGSSDPDERYYARSVVRNGLEWACKKAVSEGRPNPHGDLHELDPRALNEMFRAR